MGDRRARRGLLALRGIDRKKGKEAKDRKDLNRPHTAITRKPKPAPIGLAHIAGAAMICATR
jgi:hypothetical protein